MTLKHPKVVCGKDGFFFLGGEDSNGLDRFLTGKETLPPLARSVWEENSRKWRERLVGAAFVGLIVPEAHVIYSDKLPDDFKLVERRPVHEVLEIVGDRFFYAERLLKQLREDGLTVYTGHDSHWTEYAALETWLKIRGGLGCHTSFNTKYELSLQHEEQDLLSKVTNEDDPRRFERTYSSPDAQILFRSDILNKGNLALLYNSKAPPKRLIAFTTSFGLRLVPFMGADFREVLLVYGTAIDWNLISTWHPDSVLMEMPERFVHWPAMGTESPTTLIAMLTRSKRSGQFTFEKRDFPVSPESGALLEKLGAIERWLGSDERSAKSDLGEIIFDDKSATQELETFISLMRRHQQLLPTVVGMYRNQTYLSCAFDLVDKKELRGAHLPFIPKSEMGSLVRIRILLREKRVEEARHEVNDHIKRFAQSKEINWYASYLGISPVPSL
jgi:hypothetical protein